MRKRNKILNLLFIIIFLSIITKSFSQLNKANLTEREIYNKSIIKYESIKNHIKTMEIKMKSIQFNLKLKFMFKNIKELNKTIAMNATQLQKKFKDKRNDINKLSKEINSLYIGVNLLENKTIHFMKKYNYYDNIKSELLNYIKIFFICFFSVVFVLLIILIIVGIIQYKKRKKYMVLHEEVSLNIERKTFDKEGAITDIKVAKFSQDEKSSGRDIKLDSTPKSKEII